MPISDLAKTILCYAAKDTLLFMVFIEDVIFTFSIEIFIVAVFL